MSLHTLIGYNNRTKVVVTKLRILASPTSSLECESMLVPFRQNYRTGRVVRDLL